MCNLCISPCHHTNMCTVKLRGMSCVATGDPRQSYVSLIFPGIPKSHIITLHSDIMYTPGLDCLHLILGEESHNRAAEAVYPGILGILPSCPPPPPPPHPTTCSHCVQVSWDTRDPPKLSPPPILPPVVTVSAILSIPGYLGSSQIAPLSLYFIYL